MSEVGKVDLKSMDRATLAAWLHDAVGATPTQALHVFKALWQGGAPSVAELAGVGVDLRRKLERVATLSSLVPERVLPSEDGTTKYLWTLPDGHAIESVLIPDGNRLTLCLSTQVGCAMACTFCVTGDMGLKRHLTPAEIADQPLQVGLSLPPGQRITNLVIMGMGEPLHNLEALLGALRTLLDDHGLNFSHRRVTVSTVGLVPRMAELAAALPVNLAVSLNATTEDQRRQIMPITRKHSLEELLEACRTFPLPSGKRILFEYVLFAGFNDTDADADRLVALLRGIPAKVNLIPYNENPHRDLRRPSDAVVEAFRERLMGQGMATTVRSSRGRDVSAACGQLGHASARVPRVASTRGERLG